MRPRRSRQGPLSLLALALAIGVTACDSGPPAAPPAPAKAAQPAAKAAQPAAQAQPAAPLPPVYAYEAKGRRDPFRPLIVPRVTEPTTAKPKPKTGLAALDVKDLKVAGIVWERRGYFALIEAPNGTGYVVRVNDSVGEDARVAKITPEAITFEVKPAVAAPNVKARVVELRLRKEE